MIETTLTYSSYVPMNLLLEKGISGTVLKVYMALHNHAIGKDTKCNPSQELLSQETGLSVKTVNTALKKLHDLKIIQKIRKGLNQVNEYILSAKKQLLEWIRINEEIKIGIESTLKSGSQIPKKELEPKNNFFNKFNKPKKNLFKPYEPWKRAGFKDEAAFRKAILGR